MKTATAVQPPPRAVEPDRMNALVYHGPRKRTWEDHARPTIQSATDAIVRITTSTICSLSISTCTRIPNFHSTKSNPPLGWRSSASEEASPPTC